MPATATATATPNLPAPLALPTAKIAAAPREPRKVKYARMSKTLKARADEAVQLDYPFMDSVQFATKGIEKDLFREDLNPLPLVAWYQPTRDDAADAIAGTPQLMTAAEEKVMFLRFNFAKRKLGLLVKKAEKDGVTRELAEELVAWHTKMEHLREYLTRTNLALVLAMAKRTRLGDVDFAEVVSEGNMALLRAVEKFNVDKGFKFSTYACRAILKAFSRIAVKHSRHRQRFPVEFEPTLERSDWGERRRENVEKDLTDELKQIVDRNLAQLSDVEQTVIRRRFNWEENERSPLTLEEVGAIIGVTKERVRQIQNKALAKIRRLMEDGVLRARTEPASALEA